jgi:hypothetical protein
METKRDNTLLYLTFLLAILVASSAYCGIFINDTYAHETKNWRIQGIGQDMVDLFIIVPVLILSGISTYLNKRISFFIFGGTLLYISYSYAIYCFGLHFNYLFLVYCFTLGLSVYSFIYFLSVLPKNMIKSRFDDKAPVKLPGAILIFIALLFYFLWLSEIVPAVIQNKTPKSLTGTGLLTNPVHVLDISLFLPGLVMTSIFLLKRNPLGYLLTPVMLVFCTLMAINIAGLVVIMKLNALTDSFFVAEMMGLLAVICIFFLFAFLSHLKKNRVLL